MKVRVLKEMPFAKVGEEIEVDVRNSCWIGESNTINIENMIKDGWLEEVKEESLENKFWSSWKDSSGSMSDHIPTFAQIAKEHYLEVFDKVRSNIFGKKCLDCETLGYFLEIRKALEKG